MAESGVGVINAPATVDTLREPPPAANESAAASGSFSDPTLEWAITDAVFARVVSAAREARLAGVVYTGEAPSKLVSQIIAAKIKDEVRKVQEKQQVINIEKAKKIDADLKRAKEHARARKKEDGISEWDIFMRGGLAGDEKLQLWYASSTLEAAKAGYQVVDMSCADHFTATVPMLTPGMEVRSSGLALGS